MSQWTDPGTWARLRSGEACVICRQGSPNDLLVEPHFHMHFYPRYPGDPFEGGPINPKAIRKPTYAPGEIAEIRRRLREALVPAV
jgi:diadenosine tetraphosphate (Ap4A) HIT family hydrolase